jgi:GAF domain-containing protein
MSLFHSRDRKRKTAGLLDRVKLEQENAQLLAKTHQLSELLEIASALVSILSPDGVLIRIVESAVSLANAEEGVLMLLDEQTNELYVKTQKGLGGDHVQTLRLRVNDSMAGHVLKTGKPIRLNQDSKVVTGYTVKAAIYMPVAFRDELYGVLLVDNRQADRSFTEEEEDLLGILSQYAAIAIKNASLVENLRGTNRLLTGLHQSGRSTLSTLSLDRVLNQVAENAIEMLEADLVVLYEYDKSEDNIILPPVVQGRMLEPELLRDIGQVVPHKRSVVFKMISRGETFYAPKAGQDWTGEGLIDLVEDRRQVDIVAREGIASSAGVLLATDQETVGIMFVNYRAPRPFTDEDVEIVEMFAHQAAIAIQNARLFSLEQEQIKLLGDLTKRERPSA